MTIKNSITVFENGPLHIVGDLELKNSNGDLIERNNELYLCRCGMSNNKPYCDGQHKQQGFRQSAEFIKPPKSEVGIANEGVLEIKVQPNGPLIFKGVASIEDRTGQKVIRKVGGLCRCGQSSNSPFCDGTHAKIDFVAE